MTARVFCAIDTPDLDQSIQLVRNLSAVPLHFKLGLEFFTAQGLAGVEKIRAVAGDRAEIFLDLKLHDIPNTVVGAVSSALCGKPQFLTIHASGGAAMMKAAVAAAEKKTKILAVTVLTNLDDNDLSAIGQATPAADQVLRLARLAQDSGVDGIVCSPHEIKILRQNLGRNFLLVVPGIRPSGSAQGDQKRTMTPKEALDLGASYLVIGRPITAAADPLAAAKTILDMK
ncbi:MAG: orotidine-5'-phosphate decarboxylase [Proteobacteria bacterium]|nr:orotidine-5'-phosphate decarboxylase [Pseudomonadota bacterium]